MVDSCWVILTNNSVFTVSILGKIGLIINSMGLCKKDIAPLLTHWSYVFLALIYRNYIIIYIQWGPYRWLLDKNFHTLFSIPSHSFQFPMFPLHQLWCSQWKQEPLGLISREIVTIKVIGAHQGPISITVYHHNPNIVRTIHSYIRNDDPSW